LDKNNDGISILLVYYAVLINPPGYLLNYLSGPFLSHLFTRLILTSIIEAVVAPQDGSFWSSYRITGFISYDLPNKIVPGIQADYLRDSQIIISELGLVFTFYFSLFIFLYHLF
jgi:hypothetical protein